MPDTDGAVLNDALNTWRADRLVRGDKAADAALVLRLCGWAAEVRFGPGPNRDLVREIATMFRAGAAAFEQQALTFRQAADKLDAFAADGA